MDQASSLTHDEHVKKIQERENNLNLFLGSHVWFGVGV
jgi:hypothetical protein